MRTLNVVLLSLAAMAVVATKLKATPPVFPLDWTANEEDFMVVYQGQYVQQNGMYCCGDASCEVQTEYQSGMDYFDYTHNRTRFDDPVQGSIVSMFYPIYKEMAVDASNTCTSYCPIEDDLDPYEIETNSTDMGQKVVNGHTCEDWQYKQIAFGVIVMETDDIFADTTSNLPVQEVDQLTPFGQPIGMETATYHTFVPGTPDPSHFAIKGINGCPMDPNCGNNMRQFVRRRWKLRNTWLKWYQANNLAKYGNTPPKGR